jgi:hypothetical protein
MASSNVRKLLRGEAPEMKLIHSICAAAVMLMAVPAHAVPVWSSNATSCAADADSIMFDRYTTSKGIVAHRSTNVDPIQLSCEISDPSSLQGTQWNLIVTYLDSTGMTNTANVTAKVMRISRTTGVQKVVATFNSDSSAATTMGQGSVGFSHTFDFTASFYYVLITLDRNSTSEIVQVVGAVIEPLIG